MGRINTSENGHSAEKPKKPKTTLAKLQEQRRVLVERLAPPTDNGQHNMPNLLDAAIDGSVREFEQNMRARNLEALRGIERAIQAEMSGVHQLCQACFKRIPKKRLEALPSAVTCVDCARTEAEGNGTGAYGEEHWSRVKDGEDSPDYIDPRTIAAE